MDFKKVKDVKTLIDTAAEGVSKVLSGKPDEVKNGKITDYKTAIPERMIMGYKSTRRVWMGGRELHPEESQRVWNHSPDGFSWGYGGSGPAQLALAIMLKLTTQENAKQLYQRFKWEFVARWPDDFSIPLKDVEEWVKERETL